MDSGPHAASVAAAGPISHAVRVAQVFGVTATAFLAGQTASTSYLFLPVLLSNSSPSLLIRQWSHMLHLGHKLSPPVITALSLLFTWLATMEARPPDPITSGSSLLRQGLRTLPRRGRAFAVAALVLPIVVPYTMFFMWPINRVLLSRNEALQMAEISKGNTTAASDRLKQSLGGQLGRDNEPTKQEEIEEEESGDAGFGLFESPSPQRGAQNTPSPPAPGPTTSTPKSEENIVSYHQTSFIEFVKEQASKNYRPNETLNSHELVDRWGWMNLGRAALVSIGAGFTAWGMVL